METIPVNKVAQSGIVTLKLESLIPSGERRSFDISSLLFHGMVLREKQFREDLKAMEFEPFRDCIVSVFCSTDAIVPTWAYMLISIYLQPVASEIIFGNPEQTEAILLDRQIQLLDAEEFRDKKVVVKGCSDIKVDESAYVSITRKLLPVVSSLMYGEPCSTVPLYKRR